MIQEKQIYDEINTEKEICKKNIFNILEEARSYHVNNVDISKYYELPQDFEKYQIDDTTQRYKLNNDIVEYKIELLNSLLTQLYSEKEFLEFKFKKEQELPEQEYIEYSTNVVVRNELVTKWYNEFNK